MVSINYLRFMVISQRKKKVVGWGRADRCSKVTLLDGEEPWRFFIHFQLLVLGKLNIYKIAVIKKLPRLRLETPPNGSMLVMILEFGNDVPSSLASHLPFALFGNDTLAE